MSLFSPRKKKRRPSRGNRRCHQHLLEVSATAETERLRRNQKLFLYVGQAVAAIGVLVFSGMALMAMSNYLLFENDSYKVRVVEVNTDGVMGRTEVLTRTGISEGLNIFSLNLESAQAALASIPEIEAVRVERILPDTVTIEIQARRPVAWIAAEDTGVDPSAMESACLVDGQGVMMKSPGFQPGYTVLPVIYGVPTEQWLAGDTIDIPELHAALELLSRASARSNPDIILRAVYISKGWCVLAWVDPETLFTFGLDNLSAQIDRLQLIMSHVGQTSRKIATANLIPERNTPVTFQGEPAPKILRATAVDKPNS